MPPKLNVRNLAETTLPFAWFQAVTDVLEQGREFEIDKGSFDGRDRMGNRVEGEMQTRLEFDYFSQHIWMPGVRPLAPEFPENFPIEPPTTDDKIDNYLSYVMTDYKAPNEDYTYGERMVKPKIRLWENPKTNELYWEKTPEHKEQRVIQIGPSSIDHVIKTYTDYGHRNNQMIMQVGMPSDIILDDPPCLRHIDTRVQDDYLHFIVYFRSWDLWNGYPENLGGIQLLKEYMASEIGVNDGEMIVSSKGLHLYGYAVELAELRTMAKAKQRLRENQ